MGSLAPFVVKRISFSVSNKVWVAEGEGITKGIAVHRRLNAVHYRDCGSSHYATPELAFTSCRK